MNKKQELLSVAVFDRFIVFSAINLSICYNDDLKRQGIMDSITKKKPAFETQAYD